jgi:tetratricopeptide (TPR) repeat protein
MAKIFVWGFFVSTLTFASHTIVHAQGQTNFDLARQYMSTGEYDKAIVYWEKQYAIDPFGTYKSYLECYLFLKDYDKAEKLVKKHQKKNPAIATLWIDLGKIQSLQGNEEEAKELYGKAIKNLFPEIQQINSLGQAFGELRLFGLAEQTYLEGRRLMGGSYPFGFELADVYAQQNDFAKMIEEYLNMLEYSENYASSVQSLLQNKLSYETDTKLADIIRTALLRRVQKSGQKTIYNELLYWLLLQERDFASALTQAIALDRRNDENGSRIISLGKSCYSNGDFETAEACFAYIISKGSNTPYYINARLELINARDGRITSSGIYDTTSLRKLQKNYEETFQELGKTPLTASLLPSYARLMGFQLNDIDKAVSILEETIALPRVPTSLVAECKLQLGDILILKGEVWDASLYYSQVDKDFKNDAIGREAKYRNARLSYYMGEFEWAAAQLNVLKAATSQLISNDAMQLGLLIMDNLGTDSITEPLQMYSRADLFEFCNRYNESLSTLDSLLISWPGHSLTDEIWFKQASILAKKGDYVKAAELYSQVFQNYPDDILADDAMFRLAEMMEFRMNKKEDAKAMYETILTKYPGSLFTVEARKRFRKLRGDT